MLSAANVPDSKVFEGVVDAIEPIRRPAGKPGPPPRRPDKLHSDKGYDFLRQQLPLRACSPAWNDPRSFANIGAKPGGVQGFTALLRQLALWC